MSQRQEPVAVNTRRIITEKEAAQIRGCSEDTLKRNSERGGKPTRVKISKRRVGYWLDEVLEA
jgi:predicted DNA-binding transcriptional regulator AlpA